MRRRNRRYLACLGVAVLVVFMQASQSAERYSKGDDLGDIDVAPVLRVEAKSDLEVTYVFTNKFNKEFRYLIGSGSQVIAGLWLVLYRDGRAVHPRGSGVFPPTLTKSRIIGLKKGDSVVTTEKLRARYGALEAGLYELRAVYELNDESVQHLKFGMTPFKMDRRVALLEVR